MADIDLNAKYGNTSPVKLCGEAHGVPADHTYAIADNMLHHRTGIWQDRAQDWVRQNIGPQHQVEFFADLMNVLDRAH